MCVCVRAQPQAFIQNSMDLATRWLRPDTQMMEEIMDALVLAQVLQGLSKNILEWVIWLQLISFDAAVKLMEKFEEVDL